MDNTNLNSISDTISKISFLFLVFAVIAGGYVTQVLPCQTQSFLQSNIYAKHLTGVILLFCFIMMEGGWDFNPEENNKASVDWASGNTIHSLVWGLVLYITFLLTSKMQLKPNLLFYGLLFSIYIINTYRTYLENRKNISAVNNQRVTSFTIFLICTTILTFVYGITDYYKFQRKSYGKNFSTLIFLLGKPECGALHNCKA